MAITSDARIGRYLHSSLAITVLAVTNAMVDV
jgi:hypothetical protein